MRPGPVRSALLACLLTALAVLVIARPAGASTGVRPQSPPSRHVVVVGLSGLRWSEVSQAGTPTLWRLAGQGSVGSLVDYAVLPLTCPADGWLTLNSGTRAQSDHTNAGCGTFPAVTPTGSGAEVPGLPALISYNRQFQTTPSGACWPAARAAPPPSARAPRWPWPTPPGTSRPTCPPRRACPRRCCPAAR